MKALLTAILALVLVGPDYPKMLGEAKYSLSESLDKGLKEAGEGTVVKAMIEVEGGKTIYTMDIAQGTKICEVNLAVGDGSVVAKDIENEDRTAIVKAFKITLKQAIDAAVKKTNGKAVAAELVVKGDHAEAIVQVWADSKLVKASVDSAKGEVTSVGDVKTTTAAPKKPGFIGINGEVVDGGVKITQVVKDMPASKAGLKEGDIVTSVNGKAVKTIADIAGQFAEIGEGGKAKIAYTREAKKSEVEVTLGARPAGDEEGEEGDEGDEGDEKD
jgi:uncharacterized membrane protein YkoI